MLLEIGLRLGGFIVTSLKEHKYRAALSAKETFRILCLGESISLGSYPNHLERILNQSNKSIEFRVINKAMSGTDSTYILDHLEQNLNLYNPDIAIIMTGINDRYIKYYEDIPDAGGFLFTRSLAYRFLRLWMHFVKQRNTQEQGKDLYKNTEETPCIHRPLHVPQGSSTYPIKGDLKTEESLKEAIKLNPRDDRAYVSWGNSMFVREDSLMPRLPLRAPLSLTLQANGHMLT